TAQGPKSIFSTAKGSNGMISHPFLRSFNQAELNPNAHKMLIREAWIKKWSKGFLDHKVVVAIAFNFKRPVVEELYYPVYHWAHFLNGGISGSIIVMIEVN